MAGRNSRPRPILRIDGEHAVIDPTDHTPGSRPNGILTSYGRKHEISIDGDPSWHKYPWISPSTWESGGRSIGFDMFACPDNENLPHRAEVALVNCVEKAHPLASGIRRFVGLSFYLHPLSEVPRNWTLIFQVWQFSRFSPPFSVEVQMGKPNDPFTLDFKVRNDREQDHLFFQQAVLRGTWYRLVFEFLPAHIGAAITGKVAVWFSESGVSFKKTPAAVYQGPWGYLPGPTKRGRLPKLQGDVAAYDLYEVRFGVYRRKQERRLLIHFDNVTYADDFAAAARQRTTS